MAAAEELARLVGPAPACAALTVSRASLYRRRRGHRDPARRRPTPPRALAVAERERVCALLHAERFVDKAPAQIYAMLLDEGTSHGSTRMMYRLLAAEREVRERRHQRRHPADQKPELLATAPNQVWTWDITKLLGPVKGISDSLYVILDIFSRYVKVSRCGSARSGSRRPIAVPTSPTTTRTPRRSARRASTARSFPNRFGSYEDALAFCRTFFEYDNQEHRHSGIGLMTPSAVHHGLAPQIVAARQDTLRTAYARHPKRFVRQPPRPPILPEAAGITPPVRNTTRQDAPGSTIVTQADIEGYPPIRWAKRSHIPNRRSSRSLTTCYRSVSQSR